MKKLHSILILFSIASILTISCNSNKKLQAANSKIAQLKKDSVESSRQLKSKNSSSKNKTATTSVKKTNTISSRVPPLAIEKKFKKTYPDASAVGWMRVVPLNQIKENGTRDYKVNFLLYENENSIVYNQSGHIIETRVRIMPDQLPPNIHKAIHEKYPGEEILSTSTLKNDSTIGSYIAQIRTQDRIKEVILTETGEFVEP